MKANKGETASMQNIGIMIYDVQTGAAKQSHKNLSQINRSKVINLKQIKHMIEQRAGQSSEVTNAEWL